MTYGTLASDVIQSSTAGTPPQFNDGNSTQIGTLCRAWVSFNGVTTASILGSFNVSSVTRTGTGQYTVNFTNAMSDTNYAAVGTTTANRVMGIDTRATTSCGCDTQNGGAFADQSYIALSIFR